LFSFLQSQAAGLPEAYRFQVTQNEITLASVLNIGEHKLEIEPLITYQYAGNGQPFVGMKLECRLDGKMAERYSMKGLEFAPTVEAASERIFSQWWRVQAVPSLGYLLKAAPVMVIGDVEVWMPVVTAPPKAKPGTFPATLENHRKILALATEQFSQLKPGESYTAIASRQKQPPFTLARNWDGGWLVDEKASKRNQGYLPVASFIISLGPDEKLTKAFEQLLVQEKVTDEFAFGYIMVKKAG
jgi:hypothetical protein